MGLVLSHASAAAAARRIHAPKARPSDLLFPRQKVRKVEELWAAEGFLGAYGGHDATVREDITYPLIKQPLLRTFGTKVPAR